MPEVGSTISGTPRYITIDDIIKKYVEINLWLVAVANPDGNFPSFANARLTDFWDTTAAENSNQ